MAHNMLGGRTMLKMSLTAAATLALLVPSIAAAQPAAAPAAPLIPLPTVAPQTDAPDAYSPQLALGLSLGVTALGYGGAYWFLENEGTATAHVIGLTSAAAIAFGPSAGHLYQGDFLTRGLALRAAGAVATVVGGAATICFDHCEGGDNPLGVALLGAGLIAFGAGTIDDIITAPLSASRRNREARARMQLTVAPRITGKDAGFVVAGRF